VALRRKGAVTHCSAGRIIFIDVNIGKDLPMKITMVSSRRKKRRWQHQSSLAASILAI